jgi:hypothetical protein
MEQIPSGEDDNFDTQQIIHPSCKQRVHYIYHKNPPLDPTLICCSFNFECNF